tara:strand:- start:285 stop:893 length:609 start_codon:yes stop_codon:yes gene_type:complete
MVIFLLSYCFFFALPEAHAQQPGFSADNNNSNSRQLTGHWLNEFPFAQPGQSPRIFWQLIEFVDDGSTAHDYFSRDPLQHPANPYTRVVSAWHAGTFVDPQSAKGIFPVVRIEPSEQINYDADRDRFQHITGNFGPQFRRFTLSADGTRLTLSELVVLEVPGNIIISFPTDARNMVFHRLPDPASIVLPQSWGRIKQAAPRY